MDEFEAIEGSFAAYAKQLESDAEARYQALRACSFFFPVSDDGLRHIAGLVSVQTFFSDVCLTTQDDETQAFYVILRGSAEAFRNGKRVGVIETGECIGEGIFFSDGSITTSATVIADYKIIAATFSKDVVATLQSNPDLMVSMDKALLLALFKKLKNANQKIEELLLLQSMRD